MKEGPVQRQSGSKSTVGLVSRIYINKSQIKKSQKNKTIFYVFLCVQIKGSLT